MDISLDLVAEGSTMTAGCATVASMIGRLDPTVQPQVNAVW